MEPVLNSFVDTESSWLSSRQPVLCRTSPHWMSW